MVNYRPRGVPITAENIKSLAEPDVDLRGSVTAEGAEPEDPDQKIDARDLQGTGPGHHIGRTITFTRFGESVTGRLEAHEVHVFMLRTRDHRQIETLGVGVIVDGEPYVLEGDVTVFIHD